MSAPTTIRQSAPPLKLERLEPPQGNPKDRPISYPMQPVDMGCDLYETADNPDDTESGMQRRAPFQYGDWVAQPSYERALPFIFDRVSSTCFARSLHPAVAAGWDPGRVKRALDKLLLPPEVRWIHGLRLTPTNDLRNYALVVVDFMHEHMVHSTRRDILEACIGQLGIRMLPEHGEVYLVPEVPETNNGPLDLWYGMHLMNAQWKMPFFDGVIMKRANAKYFIQQDDFNIQSLHWHLHRFTDQIPTLDAP